MFDFLPVGCHAGELIAAVRRSVKRLTSLREHFVTLDEHDGDTWMSQRPISTSTSDAAPSWQPAGGHLFSFFFHDRPRFERSTTVAGENLLLF